MPKTKIAIAGGTGTIGTSILTALTTPPNPEKYTPVILSRATPSNPPGTTSSSKPNPGIRIETEIETRYVDYYDPSLESLTTSLSDIHTLISTLLIPDPSLFTTAQLNLLRACENAGVKRFAPSEFALSQAVHGDVDVDRAKSVVWDAVCESVGEGRIDAAAFPCGMFMNYLAIGAPREEEGRAGFAEGGMMFHFDTTGHGDNGERERKRWVEVPVDRAGRFPQVSMTDIRDVGRFVVAALGMREAWGGGELGMVGETMGLEGVVGLCRRVVGEEIEVRTVREEELRARMEEMEEGDVLGRMECQYLMVCGRGGSVVQPVLNGLCPEVRPMGIGEFLERYWSC